MSKLEKEIYNYWNNRTPMTWGPYKEMHILRYGLQDYMHKIFDFDKWKGKTILEIGAGAGIDAVEFARYGAIVHATDLTDKAIGHTTELANKLNINLNIRKADATNLPYENEFFDLVYAFGILHHIPQVEKAMDEIHRVLKPGGKCYAMLYHKNSLLYHYSILYLWGILYNGFREGLTEEQLTSRYSEAKKGCPYTKAYTIDEARELFKFFSDIDITIEYPMIDTIADRKIRVPNLPKHLGWHLIIKAKKPC